MIEFWARMTDAGEVSQGRGGVIVFVIFGLAVAGMVAGGRRG